MSVKNKNSIKQTVFLLDDRFELSSEGLQIEAEASAQRRAEVMGWSVLDVSPYGGTFSSNTKSSSDAKVSHAVLVTYEEL